MEFRFTRKTGAYQTSYVRNERRKRNKHGCAIQYQILAQFNLRSEYFQQLFPPSTRGWSRIEVPRGCFAEFPHVFTYKSVELLDADTGWWVVAYTDFAANVAAFILYELYDQIRIWALSTTMVRYIRALDLMAVFGNK